MAWEYSRNRLANLFLLFFVVVMTGLLVHLSAPFYMKSHPSLFMAYTLAAVVELSLLFLVTLKVNGFWEKLAKQFLIVALSAYALLPIALNPIFEAQKGAGVGQSQMQQSKQKTESLRSEIQSRNSKVQILRERGRIIAAQSALHQITQLESEVRNTIAIVQPVAESAVELHSSYLLALQRLLLMMCNLFMTHQLAIRWRLKAKAPRMRWSPLLAIGGAT
jgi:hypothetical protein